MTYVALARKWRPQKFEDVIGQKGAVDTLKNAIDAGRLAQSFIFAGPRGVGKTTTARILARALNCVKGPTSEPCGVCDACREIAEGRDVDVLEIDGATYTGVDAVREVIVEPLGIAPMRDRYKIFIIDEVHRLSKNAFDALLKSIEEPPPHAKFMMATTALDQVPVTIQSRSQVFELKALPFAQIKQQLKDITGKEKVQIEDGALALVARSAEGSMRDALSALDQVLAFTANKVTTKDVSTVLGLIGRDLQFEIADTVAREDAGAVFGLGQRVVDEGFDLRIVCRELARLMRDLMVLKIDPARVDDPEIAAENEKEPLLALAKHFSREDLMRAFDLLSRTEFDIRNSSHPRHHFEMALMKWIHLRQLKPLSELLAAPVGRSFSSGSGSGPSDAGAKAPAYTRPAAPPPTADVGRSFSSGPAKPAGDLKAALMSNVRESNKVFFSMVIAQAQSVEHEGDSLVFAFAPVHKSLRTQFEGKKGWLEQIAAQIAGRPIKVIAKDGDPAVAAAKTAETVQAAAKQADLKAKAKSEPGVQNILDVFGGDIESVEEL
ncbi:MAG: DNA polymerase III subunit gamma/tau [Acidobacteria bacterium]|nr:MAG: DNA polymerase III subunit gamma/tau [Acidobacteriota bacterium]